MTRSEYSLKLKEDGNQAFAEGDWSKALACYTQAINLIEFDSPEKAVLYKNKAAVHLKVSDYEAAIEDSTKSLDICPNDPKALFRRCQAYEALEKYEEAYKDARQVHNLDTNNKAIAPILKRLHTIVQNRVTFCSYFNFTSYLLLYLKLSMQMEKFAQTANKVSQMMEISFDIASSVDKRVTSTSNLLVLAKEKSGKSVC